MAKRANVTDAQVDEVFGNGGDIFDRVVDNPRPHDKRSRPARVANATRRPPVPTVAEPEEEESEQGDKAVKVSLYLLPDDISKLDQIIIDRRKRTGRSARRTHLIREAIQTWMKAQR